jgi:glycosyltransferase involved in cell wall biosynthesis
MTDLSVLIPARNEMWLRRTVEDVLSNIRGDTEIIVVLDGAWAEPRLVPHERVTIIHRPESIGQRAATNEAARVSDARYIMKLDAHCSVAPGFDVALLEAAKELGEDVTQIPGQYNLHCFDIVCNDCGFSRYQRDTQPCEKCKGTNLRREVVWKRRRSRYSTAWRFTRGLIFQYWGKFKARQVGDLPETMSCLGACWFMSRARYWELGGLDEGHGGWGQMGTEIACKSWLSGGRMVCNTRTWYAHLFRTRGGDFSFPYPLLAAEVETARAYSKELWLKDRWPKAKRPLKWLIDHFAPVPDWEKAKPVVVEAKPVPEKAKPVPLTKGIVYYSDCRGDETILGAARAQLLKAVNGFEVVSATLAPVDFGDIQVVFAHRERGHLTMFRQILAGLEMSDADVIFFAEHDVLYHPSHFDFTPPSDELVYYNANTWKVDAKTGRALHYLCCQTSGLCAYRELLLEHYRKRVAMVEEHGFTRKMGFEPGTHNRPERVDDLKFETWMSTAPNIDIRHEHNLTKSRWRQDQFRNPGSCVGWTEADGVPGWGKTKGRFSGFLEEVVS